MSAPLRGQVYRADLNFGAKPWLVVSNNDRNRAPSSGDFFSIKLSSGTAVTSELHPAAVFYARAGVLRSGNLTVD